MSRILVVDDDPDLRVLVGAYLKAAGHTVEFAEDGVAGVAAARGAPLDLILTDFQMPRMDGFGLFNALRADPRAAQVPVIMLTGHGSREMLNKALELGLDDFVTKPFDRDDLMQIVADRLKPQKTRAVAAAAPAVVPGAAVAPAPQEFAGSVLCCYLLGLERFALALKPEELEELLANFAADAAGPLHREGGILVPADAQHFHGVFGEGGDHPARSHALRALHGALAVVLTAQRLKPWIASRFAGRDLPELVVSLGVHSGSIRRQPGGRPAGEAAEGATHLAESGLKLRWSVVASRATAEAADFGFLAGRGAQLPMPESQASMKVVEVKGLARPTTAEAKAAAAAALIEAAVNRNANLVAFAALGPKPAAPVVLPAGTPAAAKPGAAKPGAAEPAAVPAPSAPAGVPGPVPGYAVLRKLADNGVVAAYLVTPEGGTPQQVLKTILISGEPRKRSQLQKLVDRYAVLDAIEHPNIARISAQGLTATHFYVVQEYCPGGDLRNLIAERMLADDVVKALLRILAGLRTAHQKGFFHGDLKPSNVLLRADGSLALVDFGLARIVEYVVGEGEAGVIMRSPDYLSPETINGQPADAQGDIYTLGLLLHELLTGRRAYESPDFSQVMMDHLNAPVPKLPAGYERFQPLLDKLMAKRRDERFASVQEVIAFMAQARLQA